MVRMARAGGSMQVGDLVKHNSRLYSEPYLGIVLDTTCVQANVCWFTSPSGDAFSSWVYLRALEVVA